MTEPEMCDFDDCDNLPVNKVSGGYLCHRHQVNELNLVIKSLNLYITQLENQNARMREALKTINNCTGQPNPQNQKQFAVMAGKGVAFSEAVSIVREALAALAAKGEGK